MKSPAALLLSCLLLAFLTTVATPHTAAQVQVNNANPNNTTQGTVNLNVIVSGNGFKKGAKAQWFVTGTTNPGGVTVNSTTFNNSQQLTANISVAADAVIANFDIQVVNTDGRTGKGTELFAVKTKQTTACPALAPLNPVPLSVACSTAGNSTCLDATFGNAGQVPPGGLVLTNTDGMVASQSDVDAAQAVLQQKQPDGSARLIAIGDTSDPSHVGYPGVAVLRYNQDGTLDTNFGSGGVAKYFPSFSVITLTRDGAVDPQGNVVAVADEGGAAVVVRFTPSGALDATFNSMGAVSISNVKPTALRIQSDGKILLGGTRVSGKSVVGVVARLNSNGTIDSAFGSNGFTAISSLMLLYALQLETVNSQQDIVVAGETSTATSFGLVRLTPSGALDSSFGTSGGLASANFCGNPSTAFSLLVDPLGNIVAGGTSSVVSGGAPQFGLTRFTSSGILDTTFGNPSNSGLGRTGQTMLDFFGNQNRITSIQQVLDANGNETAILVGGYAYLPTGPTTVNKYLVIAKYHTDGSLDTSFGTNGGASIDLGSADNYVLTPAGSNLLTQADGRAVIGGTAGFTSGPFTGYNFALARLWP